MDGVTDEKRQRETKYPLDGARGQEERQLRKIPRRKSDLVPKPGLYEEESLDALTGAAIPPFPLLDAERAIHFSLPVFVSLHPD